VLHPPSPHGRIPSIVTSIPSFFLWNPTTLSRPLSDVTGHLHRAIKQLSSHLNTALNSCPIKPFATQQVGISRPT
jgi:hypothetical protein